MAGVSPEMEELMKAASASEDGGRTSTTSKRRAVSASHTSLRTSGKHKAVPQKGAGSGAQAVFFGLVALLGAAGVYFGMYLAGFYDLVFTF